LVQRSRVQLEQPEQQGQLEQPEQFVENSYLLQEEDQTQLTRWQFRETEQIGQDLATQSLMAVVQDALDLRGMEQCGLRLVEETPTQLQFPTMESTGQDLEKLFLQLQDWESHGMDHCGWQ